MTAESLLETNKSPDGFSEAPFYISARVQNARARRTLKHDDAFIVLDSHGDLGASSGGQDGLFTLSDPPLMPPLFKGEAWGG